MEKVPLKEKKKKKQFWLLTESAEKYKCQAGRL